MGNKRTMHENRNLEIVRRLYERLNRGDLDAVAELTAPDLAMRWDSMFGEDDVGTYHGHDGLRRWWSVRQKAHIRSVTPGSVQAEGDEVIARGWVTTGDGESGMTIRIRWRFVLRAGLVKLVEVEPES